LFLPQATPKPSGFTRTSSATIHLSSTLRFNGNFVEGVTQSMDLEDTSAEAFGIFVNWLYTQGIENSKKGLPSCEALIDLWL